MTLNKERWLIEDQAAIKAQSDRLVLDSWSQREFCSLNETKFRRRVVSVLLVVLPIRREEKTSSTSDLSFKCLSWKSSLFDQVDGL